MEYNFEIVRDIEEDKKELKRLNKIMLSLIFLLLIILPLITRATGIEFISPMIGVSPTIESGIHGDVFTYYKWWMLVLVTSALVGIFLYLLMATGYVIPLSTMNFLLAIMIVALLVSAVFAPYKTLALYGMYNRHDGTVTYICYFILLFLASQISYTTKQLKYVFLALTPVLVINTILGLLGFWGYELVDKNWVKVLLFPSDLEVVEGSRFISTINHGNYVSGFAGVLISIFMTLTILSKEYKNRIIYASLSIISFALLFTSLARSGFVAFVFTIPFILFFLVKSQEKIKGLITMGVIMIISTSIFIPMGKHNPEVWDRTVGFFVNGNPFIQEKVSLSSEPIELARNTYRNILEQISIVSSVFAESSEEEKLIPNLPEQGVGAGSGRVYIWTETLKLVKERPLTGYGMDTLPFFFPQDDPQIYANIEDYNIIVDKPHNMYIGILYGAGIFAFLTFMGILGLHFYNNATVFIKNKVDNGKLIYLAALFTGWWAYLMQAMFNDTIIGTAPIFFVLFGVAISLLASMKPSNSGGN